MRFLLTASDVRILKLNQMLATNLSNTFLSISARNNVRDPSTNSELMPLSFMNARMVSTFTSDSTRPRVIANGFTNFDLDSGQFTVVFDEPMDTNTITTPLTLFQHQATAIKPSDIFLVQSLECMAPRCQNGEMINFTFPREELNRVKLAPRICFSTSSCWLTIPAPGNFIRDMAGNAVIELPNRDRSITRILNAFIDDTTGPILEGYTLNLTSRELILSFDEPVRVTSFNISGITLQSSRGVSGNALTYQLTGGTFSPPVDGSEITIRLSDEDVNALQSRADIASQMSNTYLSLMSYTARDVSYRQNQVQPISSSNALLVGIYERDRAPPEITGFDLSLDTNTMTITFSEPVLLNSLNLDRLVLASSQVGGITYNISGGILQQIPLNASSVITFTLLNTDQTFLEVSGDIAMNVSNVFLASESGLAQDTNMLTSSALPVSQAVHVSTFTADQSPSNVIGFSLDMDEGVAIITFDDVILSSTFDVSAITFQSALSRVPLQWHTLSSSSSSSSTSNGFEIAVSIGNNDLNRLKQIRNLTTGVENSYLTVMATLANDVNGIDTIAITNGNALQVGQFTPDNRRPSLQDWTLDLNVGQIIMTYSETVDVRTLQPNQFTVLTDQGSSNAYTLTGFRSLIPPDADNVFAIQLSENDANSLKSRTTLGTSLINSYLSFSSTAIQDMNGNDVIEISRAGARQAQTYNEDLTDPELRSFSLNANTGLLRLTFDETVNASTFNVTAVTLVNRALRSDVSYTLTDSSPSVTNSAIIDINLSDRDLNGLKAIDNLATSVSDTFIIATSYAVRDMNRNPLATVTADSAIRIGLSGYIQDTTSPSLVSFTANMSSEQLILTFSETVSTSIDPTQITVQSEISNTVPGAMSFRLTGGSITRSLGGTMIVLGLEENDANELKRIRTIATNRDNTYITINSSAVQDPAGNPVVAIPANNAHQAAMVVSDVVPPRLVSFSLDLDARRLVLIFDETVNSGSFSATFVTLQDAISNPQQVVQLESFSRTNSGDGTQLLVELSDTDFNAITASFPLATMDTNTFISLRSGVVRDTSGVMSVEIPQTNALLITNHTADSMRPSLSNFELDLNNGVITLTFSESVNVTSFDATQITVQSASSNPASMHTLRGAMVAQRDSTTIDVTLLPADLNTIKRLTGLATLRSNTYISITSATVSDMNSNFVVARSMSDALLARNHVPDISGPIIQGFDLDYNSGDMTIYLDETVDLSTFQISGITLQDSRTGSGMSYNLVDSLRLNSGLETFIQVRLSNNDLNELKRLRICVAFENCYLSAANVVRDVPLTQNAPIVETSALSVGSFIPDLTCPQVTSYAEFDLDAGTFTLEFSETVDVSTTNSTQITLDNSYANATFIFELEELRTTGGDNFNVTFQIAPENLNQLKLNTDLCTHDGNCWIRLTSDFIEDISGNKIVPILPDTIGTSHRPRMFSSDVTPPILSSFDIDLNSGMMTFTFNEVVQLGTFSPMNITFQDANNSTSTVNLREHGQSYRRANGLVIEWNMTIPDLNLLKAQETIFSSPSNSYLTHSNFIEDISGTGIGFRSDALQVSAFVLDTIRPMLQSFKAFNFDNGTFALQFDEPVNISSLNLEDLAITRNRSFDLHIYDRIPINDWYSVLFENGTVYNLTHLFNVGEYVLDCPFPLMPTTSSPTMELTTMPMGEESGSGSANGSGSGSGATMEEFPTMFDMGTVGATDSPYPILLRGCNIYRNLTVIEPFYFLTGGTPTYVDERKQQVQVALNRVDLRELKLSFIIASNDSDTWIAFNETSLSDFAENPVIPTNLFNATKVSDGAFVEDVTPPSLEFIVLDMDASVLSLHFNDVMDVQSVQPLLVQISEYPGSNNSYRLQGPYPYPEPLTVDSRDNYTINIPLSFDDMNALKNNLDLATSEFNTYVTFPVEIATDIYGLNPTRQVRSQVERLIPDETGPILLAFSLDYDNRILNLTFDEVVNPNTLVHTGITIQNFQNSSDNEDMRSFQFHTFIEGGMPVDNTTGVSTLQVVLDIDMNALIVASDLGSDVNNTYIIIDNGTILDMNNNPNQRITDGNAIQVSNIVEDASPPSLLYYDLNLNDNFLTLKFSEAVLPGTLNISGITLQSTQTDMPGVTDSVPLSQNSRIIRREFNSLLSIALTMEDEEAIKNPRISLAKSAATTFLSIVRDSAEDYAGFRVQNISSHNALPVRNYFEG